METVPGIHHPGDVGPQAVRAGQRAAEVQVSGAESSDGPGRTTTEDQVLRDGQTGGLGHLQTDAALGQRSPPRPGFGGWMESCSSLCYASRRTPACPVQPDHVTSTELEVCGGVRVKVLASSTSARTVKVTGRSG